MVLWLQCAHVRERERESGRGTNMLLGSKDGAVSKGPKPLGEKHLMGLWASPLSWIALCTHPNTVFEPTHPVPAQDTVYGKRDGFISGLAVTSRDKGCIFKGTKGMRSATIHGVEMLPRASMWKPDVTWLSLSKCRWHQQSKIEYMISIYIKQSSYVSYWFLLYLPPFRLTYNFMMLIVHAALAHEFKFALIWCYVRHFFSL